MKINFISTSDQGGGKPRPYPVRLRAPFRSRVGAGLAPTLVNARSVQELDTHS